MCGRGITFENNYYSGPCTYADRQDLNEKPANLPPAPRIKGYLSQCLPPSLLFSFSHFSALLLLPSSDNFPWMKRGKRSGKSQRKGKNSCLSTPLRYTEKARKCKQNSYLSVVIHEKMFQFSLHQFRVAMMQQQHWTLFCGRRVTNLSD